MANNSRITVNSPNLGDFKGSPTLYLNPNGRASIGFGLGKAMVILENLPAIYAFLKSDGKSLEIDPEMKSKIEEFAKQFLPKQG